ncbi:unnamed protein product, partial [Prorocentrum cordatum]
MRALALALALLAAQCRPAACRGAGGKISLASVRQRLAPSEAPPGAPPTQPQRSWHHQLQRTPQQEDGRCGSRRRSSSGSSCGGGGSCTSSRSCSGGRTRRSRSGRRSGRAPRPPPLPRRTAPAPPGQWLWRPRLPGPHCRAGDQRHADRELGWAELRALHAHVPAGRAVRHEED